MTVTYTHEVADCKGFGCFWKVLFKWKGSIYKLVWPDLILYTVLYFLISIMYRNLLDSEQRRQFEMIAMYCQYFSNLIPLSFVLGFYVNIVVQRWWSQYELLPWPDSLSVLVSTSLQGQDDRSRMMRRTVVRYVNLASTITLRMVCLKVKKRFPTWDHFVEAGLLEPNEKKVLESMEAKTPHALYWMPLVWAGAIITRARQENKIKDSHGLQAIINELNRIRGNLGGLLSYDWISVPLVYTQVVTLAVYIFFLSTLMGRQFLDPKQKYEKHTIDFYVPVFTYLEFFFYMGWLKVAESLVNPFGDDDDDFEVNWLIDRNVQIAYIIVDEMHNDHPDIIQDMYWDKIAPQNLPHTSASQCYRKEPPNCSTDYFIIPEEEEDPINEKKDEENHCPEIKSHSGETHCGDLKSRRRSSISNQSPILKLFRKGGASISRKLSRKNSSSLKSEPHTEHSQINSPALQKPPTDDQTVRRHSSVESSELCTIDPLANLNRRQTTADLISPLGIIASHEPETPQEVNEDTENEYQRNRSKAKETSSSSDFERVSSGKQLHQLQQISAPPKYCPVYASSPKIPTVSASSGATQDYNRNLLPSYNVEESHRPPAFEFWF